MTVQDKARELASQLKASEEYICYSSLKEQAFKSETTRALVKEYHSLQMLSQAASIKGERDEDALNQLARIGEVLQFNKEASEYLIAEYKLNTMLGDVYKILAEAVEVDLGMFEV